MFLFRFLTRGRRTLILVVLVIACLAYIMISPRLKYKGKEAAGEEKREVADRTKERSPGGLFGEIQERAMKLTKLMKTTVESTRKPTVLATRMSTRAATPTTSTSTTSAPALTSTTLASTTTEKVVTSTTSASTSTKAPVPTMSKMETLANKIRERGMNETEKSIAMDLFKKILGVAKDLGLVHFMWGGTMVGSWRHHGMIPWDDDIDMAFNASDKDKLRDAINALGGGYKANDGSARIKMWSDSSPIQSPYSWKWPYIDVIFFENNGTHVWEKAGEFSATKYQMKDIFPLHKRPFEDMWVNAPHNSVNVYLKYYEKPQWCTTWWYSHKYESGGEMIGLDCSELAPFFPFVHRDIVNGTMRETLKVNNAEVQSLIVPGDGIDHITAPYGFRLLKGS